MSPTLTATGPQFLGIGAQKAGTTWLFHMLERHPNVRFPGGKELHALNAREEPDFDAYRARFGQRPELVQGDITPAYATLAPERVRRIAAELPDLRLFFSVRDPVDRAWSWARMALKNCLMELEEASDEWLLEVMLSRASRLRGHYAEGLRPWIQNFGAERLLLVDYRDLTRRPREVLRSVAGHIGVEPGQLEALDDGTLGLKVHAAADPRPIPEHLRPRVEEEFGPAMERFEQLVQGLRWA